MQLVSAIIPNYNNAQFLRAAVESVFAQSYPNIELIVVDDGSTDESLKVLDQFGDRISVIRQPNRGVSAARNAGIENSLGDYVAFLDADDVWRPDKLSSQIPLFADNEIGLVHCGVADIDDRGSIIDTHLEGRNGWVAKDLLRYQGPVILGGGSAVVVSRKAIETVGIFDEDLRVGEDWEFYYRVARHFKAGFVREVLVEYRRHSSNSYTGNAASVTKMRDDMLLAYNKIFDRDNDLAGMRRECFGKIHSVIAGSFFRIGSYGSFLRHAALSLFYTPTMVSHLLGFPLRLLTRGRKANRSGQR